MKTFRGELTEGICTGCHHHMAPEYTIPWPSGSQVVQQSLWDDVRQLVGSALCSVPPICGSLKQIILKETLEDRRGKGNEKEEKRCKRKKRLERQKGVESRESRWKGCCRLFFGHTPFCLEVVSYASNHTPN